MRPCALLVELAEESGVAERRDAMFRGEHINVSENRAVLHTALRLPATATLVVDGQDVVADVHAVLGAHARLRQPRPFRANSRAIPESRLRTSSTSASAGPTSGR